MEETNYEQDLKIDETALDIECLDQPTLMMRYSKLQARTEKRVGELKEALAVVEADLDLDIRLHPGRYGVPLDSDGIPKIKVTEAVVTGRLKKQEEYKEAHEDLLEAQHKNNILKGAVKSVEQRKSMLEELIKLHGQRYFAGPKTERNLTNEISKKRKREESNKLVGKRMRRGK